jgi:hypothetical protein
MKVIFAIPAGRLVRFTERYIGEADWKGKRAETRSFAMPSRLKRAFSNISKNGAR